MGDALGIDRESLVISVQNDKIVKILSLIVFVLIFDDHYRLANVVMLHCKHGSQDSHR
jgi:hypothetical protein